MKGRRDEDKKGTEAESEISTRLIEKPNKCIFLIRQQFIN